MGYQRVKKIYFSAFLVCVFLPLVAKPLSSGDSHYLLIAGCLNDICQDYVADEANALSMKDSVQITAGLFVCGEDLLLGPLRPMETAETLRQIFERVGLRVSLTTRQDEGLSQQSELNRSDRSQYSRPADITTKCISLVDNDSELTKDWLAHSKGEWRSPNDDDFKLELAWSNRTDAEEQTVIAKYNTSAGFDINKNRTTLLPDWKRFNQNANESKSFWRLNFNTPLAADLLESVAELRFSKNRYTNYSASPTAKNFLVMLGISGKQDSWAYGINYRSVGKDYIGHLPSEYSKDKASYAVWLSLQHNSLNVGTSYLESWNNVHNDPVRSKTSDRWWKIKSAYTVSANPLTQISLAYGIGERRRLFRSAGSRPLNGRLNSLNASLKFSDKFLNFTVGSNVFSANDKSEINDHFETRRYYLSGVVFPNSLISISPKYSLNRRYYMKASWTEVINSSESSIIFDYKPVEKPYRMSIRTDYGRYINENGIADRETFGIGTKLEWEIDKGAVGHNVWALKFQRKEIDNNVLPSAGYSDWTIELLWRWSIS